MICSTLCNRPQKVFRRFALAAFVLLSLIVGAVESHAQNYIATLRQRRHYDQIHVEVWLKSVSASNTTRLGSGSFAIHYNSTYLTPNVPAGYPDATTATTDSIIYDLDQTVPATAPVENITSGVSLANGSGTNGYSDPTTQSYGNASDAIYSLEINLSNLGVSGIVPGSTGRGTFLGRLVFDINNVAIPADSLTRIAWNPRTDAGDVRIFDRDSNDIESQVSFVDPDAFTVIGVTILNANGPSEVVDRDRGAAPLSPYLGTSLNTPLAAANNGYAVFFERSIDRTVYTPALVDENLGYAFDYSLNGGTSWSEFGRVGETVDPSNAITPSALALVSGSINNPNNAAAYTITDMNGNPLSNQARLRNAVRVFWSPDATFPSRSEQGRMRIRQLTAGISVSIAARTDDAAGINDASDTNFVIGRLFFAQLNGTNQYFRSGNNYSNSTQLTVETWINLNEYKAIGAETGIIASSAGPVSGAEEGQWMLYLKDGRYPAFRAREINGRGPNGYIAEIVAYDSLLVASDAYPLGAAHSGNWVHLSATVADNVISLYVNGELIETVTNTQAPDIRMGMNGLATSFPVWVGVNPNVSIGSDDYLHAGLKGTRVWRVALTQAQIRQRVAGIPDPLTNAVPGDVLSALDLYYRLEGSRTDAATNAVYQLGSDPAQFYLSGVVDNAQTRFRPDLPHIRLSSPTGNEGVPNRTGILTEVRWLGYGIGTITGDGTTDPSADIDIQFSTDGGTTWTYARDAAGLLVTDNLGGPSGGVVGIEQNSAQWQPYNNNGATPDDGVGGDLRTINYSQQILVRVRGRSAADQNFSSVSGPIWVAPYFSLQKTSNYRVEIPAGSDMNITGNTGLFEAWIRPYRFPTSGEGYFPIITKIDTASGSKPHYSFRLLPTGQLQFAITDTSGTTAAATSDTTKLLVRPNSVELDSAWTHVAVYFNRNSGVGAATVQFFIDGNQQTAQTIDSNVVLNTSNTFPTFLGYEPGTTAKSFLGEFKEIRFWNGTPGGALVIPATIPDLATFIKGAAGVRASNMTAGYQTNLVAAFDFNGGTFLNGPGAIRYWRTLPSTNTNIRANFYQTSGLTYVPVIPYAKIVEPTFRQKVQATSANTTVRWIGFDYDATTNAPTTQFDGFYEGLAVGPISPSLEFSLYGGGNILVSPYQFVGSPYWNVAQTASFELSTATSSSYVFPAAGVSVGSAPRFAGQFIPNTADPDGDNDGVYNDAAPTGQTKLTSALSNARLRLSYSYTLPSTVIVPRQGESPLFTVVPNSNFTVRALLEGYHRGSTLAMLNNISSTYSGGGVKIKLYNDNAGTVGSLADSAESDIGPGYSQLSPVAAFPAGPVYQEDVGPPGAASDFANIPFIFTNLNNGSYWVVVDQINHLPIMSRFPATFAFTGDNFDTWPVESGWDFLTWDGNNGVSVMASTDFNATVGNYFGYSGGFNFYPAAQTFTYTPSLYSAYGSAVSLNTSSGYSTTGLIYNDGQTGAALNPLPAMVGGDVVKDGQINAADRVRVRADQGTNLVRSDVSGDNAVNATDVTVVDRNFGRVSSIFQVAFPEKNSTPIQGVSGSGNNSGVFDAISPEDPELSKMFNDAVKAEVEGRNTAPRTSGKEAEVLGSTINYVVSATPIRTGNYVDVPVYIRNTGSTWNMANATFGLGYNSNVVDYVSYEGVDKVPFSNRSDLGYDGLAKSAPALGAERAIPDLRTIEISFDASPLSKKPGLAVPNTNTYLGTLRFKIKNSNRPVVFTWHWDRAVLTTAHENITDNGDWRVIPPVLTYTASVTIPNGGEKWRAGRRYSIQWNGTGSANVSLEYSLDNGANWTKFGTAISGDKTAQWSLPNTTTDKCLVRVVDAESGYEIDRSDNAFTISPALAAISRPAQADPIYVGGRTDNIKWTAQNVGNVKFEFSADGGKTWSSVSTVANASTGTLGWKVPAVNSKHAMVRMVEADNGEEISVSGEFKVLAGTVKFVNPKAAEVLKVGVQSRIRWAVENSVTAFDMEFSRDCGASWTPVKQNNEAVKGFWDWSVPALPTSQGMLRAFLPGDNEMEYARSAIFTVSGASGVEPVAYNGFMFELPSPNPASRETALKFTLPTEESVTITLHNATGQEIGYITNNTLFGAGDHTLNFNVENLASGTYFFTLKTGGASLVQQVNVVR